MRRFSGKDSRTNKLVVCFPLPCEANKGRGNKGVRSGNGSITLCYFSLHNINMHVSSFLIIMKYLKLLKRNSYVSDFTGKTKR